MDVISCEGYRKEYEKFSIPNRASQKIKPFPAPLQQVERPGMGRGTWQIGKYQYFYHNLFHLFLSIGGVEEKLYCFLFAFPKLVFIQNHSFGFCPSQSVDERRILCFYMDRSPHDVGKSKFFWKEVLIMKKILAIALALCMVLSIAAFTSAKAEDLIKVGIINNDPTESGYRAANVADMEATFSEENGYEAQFFYSLKNEEQIAQAKKFIADEVDYLLLSAAATTGWDSVLKEAEEAGVTVILFDRTIDADESLYAASVVSDMAKEGQTAVDWLAEQKLEEYNVIHIQGVMGSAAQIGRSGALDTKVEENDNWNIVIQQTGNWSADEAKQIVESVINSGEAFNVIYAENDNMAQGAVAALDAAGITHGVEGDVIVMGFDCNKWALEELLAGNWNYDGQCNPFQASTIADIIAKLEAGEELEDKVVILVEQGFDAATITAEDVEAFGI